VQEQVPSVSAQQRHGCPSAPGALSQVVVAYWLLLAVYTVSKLQMQLVDEKL